MKEFPYTLKDLESWKVELATVEGVWLTVCDASWNLFLVLEKEKKAWKKPGQWSTVMETVEKSDNGCLLTAVRRGLKEELWIELDKWEKIWPEDVLLTCYIYDSEKDKTYKVSLYLYDVVLTDLQANKALQFTNWEVGNVKAVSLNNVISDKVLPLRPWTKEIILQQKEPFFIVDGEKVLEKK